MPQRYGNGLRMEKEMSDSYELATQALQAISTLEDSLNRERGPGFPTRDDLDIIQQLGTASFALRNALCLIYEKEKQR